MLTWGRPRHIRPVQVELGEDLGELPLDLTGVPGGVLGLDHQPDLPAAAHHRGDEAAQRQELVPLMVQVGHLHLAVVIQLPGAEVQTLQGGQLERGDQAFAVGGPADVAVVGADQVGVSGEPYIALERIGAFGNGAQVGLERVLGQIPAGSPVGDDLGGPPGDWHGCFVHDAYRPTCGSAAAGRHPATDA